MLNHSDTLTTLKALQQNAHDMIGLARAEMAARGLKENGIIDDITPARPTESLQRYYDAFRGNVADLPADILAFMQHHQVLLMEVGEYNLKVAKKYEGRSVLQTMPRILYAFSNTLRTLITEDCESKLNRHFYLAAHEFTAQAFALALRSQINESPIREVLGDSHKPNIICIEDYDEFNGAHQKMSALFDDLSVPQKQRLSQLHQEFDDYSHLRAPADTIEALMDMTWGNDMRNIAISGGWITRASAKQWRGMAHNGILRFKG